MFVEDIFNDIEEIEIGGNIQLTSPFLEFFLKKNREFFIVRNISFIGEVTPNVKQKLPKMVYLHGEKLLHGGLEWYEWTLKYNENEIFKCHDIYLSNRLAEKREHEINKIQKD